MKKILFSFICVIVILSAGNAYALELEFSVNAYTFDNADFMNYNNLYYALNKSADYLNTDDRISFIYYNVSLRYFRKFLNSEFEIDIYHSAFWGADNIEGRDAGKNPILFRRLYYIYYPIKGLSLQVGRFYHDIGGAERDYFFSDTIDGIKLSYKLNDNIEFSGLFDVLGIGAKPEGTRIWFGIEKDEELIEDFNGDVISLRGGFITKLYFARIFSYFLRYGATTKGGADIAEAGKSIINKSDGDFLSLSGVRFSYKKSKKFGEIDVTGAYSYGKDYQFYDQKTYNGFAVAVNYSHEFAIPILKRIAFSGGYFHPKFASMKAQSMGGILLWGYKGYFPSVYAYFYHFKDYAKRTFGQTYIDKTVSKTFARLDIDLFFWKINISSGSLALFQTNEKLPWMGFEQELTINLIIDNITFSVVGAVYIPGNWYRDHATRKAYVPGSALEALFYPSGDILDRVVVNTYVPMGKDPFYGVNFSTSYRLSWQ